MPGIKKGMLSVCCVGYNHARFIEFNIQSLLAAKVPNIELIIVDDGSTDNSAQLLQKVTQNLPFPVKLILQKNTGNIGHNFNQAWRQAQGEFITFLSLDDALYPPTLTQAIDLLTQNSKLAFVVSSKITPIDDNNQVTPHAVPPLRLDTMPHPSVADLIQLEYSELGGFYIQGCFFRKEIIDAVGGFDEDMTGDDIVLRIKVLRYMQAHPEWNFQIFPTPLCYYRQHSTNIHLNSMRQIKIVTEYLQRYWPQSPDPQTLINWTLYALSQMPTEQFAQLFTMNLRASRLLLNQEIQHYIVKRICKEHSLGARIWSHIYKKERKHTTRTVTLFSCFTFHYTLRQKH